MEILVFHRSCLTVNVVSKSAEDEVDMQAESQAFLSASAADATQPPRASPSVTPPQREARKLRPVKLQSGQGDNLSSPAAAFADAQIQPEANAHFVRQNPRQQHELTEKDSNNPFLRPLTQKVAAQCESRSNGRLTQQRPQKRKRRSRRFVPLSQFEAAATEENVHAISPVRQKISGTPSPAKGPTAPTVLLAEADLRERITQHVSHLRTVSSYPSDFLPAIKTLLSCFHSCTNDEPVSLWPNCESGQAVVYCREVLQQIVPLFADYPAPVINAFREAFPDSGLSAPESFFPAATGVWTPNLAGSTDSPRELEAEPKSVSYRLQANLETTWDQVLLLQRMYRGDISSCPPGKLDVDVALRTMAMLHPANMDFFAARLLKLVSDTALHSRDAPIKMRQLGDRLRDAQQGKHREKGPGVVLHRLPELVRSMFGDDSAQLFFLDFLTGVDSAKLNTALVPRLVASMAKALEVAAVATTNVAFTDAVVDARIYAKLLSVTMHASNWAHSTYSLSGMDDNQVSPGLGTQALRSRVPIHSAFFTAAIDLEAFIRDAVASKYVLPVIGCVAVADVLVRLAAMDPVAKASEWYKRSLYALRSVRVVSSTSSEESMPLLRTLVCALLGSKSCGEQGPSENPDASFVIRCDKTEWSAIGDTRLLRVVCPLLDDLRKSVHMPDGSTKAAVRRITPQAAPNAASTLLQNGEIKESKTGERVEDVEGDDAQSALRKEFYARMDGRLRELIRVVVSSRPTSGTAAKEAYLKIVHILYPDTAKTIAAVAANLCEYEARMARQELEKRDNGEKGKRDRDKRTVPDEEPEVESTGKGIKEMTV